VSAACLARCSGSFRATLFVVSEKTLFWMSRSNHQLKMMRVGKATLFVHSVDIVNDATFDAIAFHVCSA